jgi:16S rRNA (uracil1498-N3)-methyltransferase
MSLHRFFATGPLPEHATSDMPLPLDARDVHHLVHVLRIRDTERIILAGTDGREAEVALTHVAADEVRGDVEEPVVRAPGPRVTLLQALTKRERMELVIQKATELGVAEIVPVVTARTIVKLDEGKASRRAERWQRIAEEAAKQSQRAFVPPVREPVRIGDLPALFGRFALVLVPWEEEAASAPGIGEALRAAGIRAAETAGAGTAHAAPPSVAVVIGPEGGLEQAEVALLVSRGAVTVSLGDTVLRTETAGIVAVALTAYELGGLGNRGPRA